MLIIFSIIYLVNNVKFTRKLILIEITTLLLILLFFPTTIFSDERSPIKEYQIAIEMYKNGYYDEARFLLLQLVYSKNLTKPFNYYARLITAISYAKESEYSKALKELSKLEERIKEEKTTLQDWSLHCEILYQISLISYYKKSFNLFLVKKEEYENICGIHYNQTLNDLNIMELSYYVYQTDWLDAKEKLRDCNFKSKSTKLFIYKKLNNILNYKSKSPVLGGILSLIPGLGHVYAGMYMDGIRSFLFNTAFTGLTLYTLKNREYIFSAIFGVIESVLYLSNIYGGINAVNHTNSSFYLKNRDEILKHIKIPDIDVKIIRKEIGL